MMEDVVNERRRVEEGDYGPRAPVVIDNLCMTYPPAHGNPAKQAVKNLSFIVEENECFALLGENGAGKTTTISILTGYEAEDF